MFNFRFQFSALMIVFINMLLSFPVFSQNYVINGILEKKVQGIDIKDSIVRRESLIIKDKQVYVQLILDEGARNITNHKRYKEITYLLPKEVTYDEVSKCIYYYKDNSEIEVGRVKSFIGFMPYIALADGITIASSPTDAKLIISLNRDSQGIPKSVIHSEESMEITLSKKCGQCHILEYIFSHKKWEIGRASCRERV